MNHETRDRKREEGNEGNKKDVGKRRKKPNEEGAEVGGRKEGKEGGRKVGEKE